MVDVGTVLLYRKTSHYMVSFLNSGFNKNPSSWARFMQKTLSGARYAPESCFKQVCCTKSLLYKGTSFDHTSLLHSFGYNMV